MQLDAWRLSTSPALHLGTIITRLQSLASALRTPLQTSWPRITRALARGWSVHKLNFMSDHDLQQTSATGCPTSASEAPSARRFSTTSLRAPRSPTLHPIRPTGGTASRINRHLRPSRASCLGGRACRPRSGRFFINPCTPIRHPRRRPGTRPSRRAKTRRMFHAALERRRTVEARHTVRRRAARRQQRRQDKSWRSSPRR